MGKKKSDTQPTLPFGKHKGEDAGRRSCGKSRRTSAGSSRPWRETGT